MEPNLDAWANTLVAVLKPQLSAALSALVEGVDPSALAALGAYTDADATSIVVAANTRTHLAEQSAARPDAGEYFRWSPAEWDVNQIDAIEQGAPDHLAAANAEIGRVGTAVGNGEAGDDGYEDFRYLVWQSVVVALGQLFDEGFFDRWPAAVQVFDVPETEIDPTTLSEWTAEMNTDPVAAEYTAWITALYAG